MYVYGCLLTLRNTIFIGQEHSNLRMVTNIWLRASSTWRKKDKLLHQTLHFSGIVQCFVSAKQFKFMWHHWWNVYQESQLWSYPMRLEINSFKVRKKDVAWSNEHVQQMNSFGMMALWSIDHFCIVVSNIVATHGSSVEVWIVPKVLFLKGLLVWTWTCSDIMQNSHSRRCCFVWCAVA